MGLLFQLDAASVQTFNQALEHLRKITGQTLGEVLFEEAGIQVQRAQQFTPLHNLAEGKNAVKADIARIIITKKKLIEILKDQVPSDVRKSEKINWKRIPMGRLVELAKKYLKIRGGEVRFGATRDELHIFHQGERVSRGRVRTYHGTMVAPAAVRNAYIKEIQEHVGMAKAGWNAAMEATGHAVPEWIARHGTTNSRFVDGTKSGDGHLFFEATNLTPYAQHLDTEAQILAKAQAGRVEAIKEKALIYLEKEIKK